MNLSDILTRQPIEPHWIVQDMLPRSTMVILAGEPGAGKSTLCYTLAYAVAAGAPFLGYRTNPTTVLYFDEENSLPDFLQYNQWAWAGLECPEIATLEPRLHIEHMTLLGGWREPMAHAIKTHQPGLVIVDTATPALHIKDENDNAEAARVIRQLRMFRALGPETTFLVLKHERQRDELGHRRTIRGAKGWLGAFDQVLYHVIAPGARRRRDGTRLTRLEPEKLRAFALRDTVRIEPVFTEGVPKGLILKGSVLAAEPAHELNEPT